MTESPFCSYCESDRAETENQSFVDAEYSLSLADPSPYNLPGRG